MPENDDNSEVLDNQKEYKTTNSAFAAYLSIKFMMLETVDTGRPLGRGKKGTMKAFVFLVPDDEDMDAHQFNFQTAADESKVPAIVMANKLRIIHQSYRKFEAQNAKV